MCPPYSYFNRESNNRHNQTLPYQQWLDSVSGCRATFYRHRINNLDICSECFRARSRYDQVHYDIVIRHYLIYGGIGYLTECALCEVVTVDFHPLATCVVCLRAHNDFVEYLRLSNDRPYHSSESTIVCITQARIQITNDRTTEDNTNDSSV
ncbi:hypothetical protein ALC57_07923 [Trachymyrmex cornetzi]|uniref:Uncharacterized protein n=1 Tax=Trachymyrmex cornetzi TaxID=471704 RepID=A0A151J7N7_9HYME|nr:hypothetical protein ALC57_07923 [Trachymyrmex cornetzi]